MDLVKLSGKIIAFSPSFTGRDGKSVDYPKYTIRIGSQLVEVAVKKDVQDPGRFLDKDVMAACEVYPSKTKAAALRVVDITED